MVEKSFTQAEAVEKVGKKVLAVNLPLVPRDTEGTVVRAVQSRTDNWRVRIRWQIPRAMSLIDAGEVSFFNRERPALSDLSKMEYEKLVAEIN